MNPFRTRLLQLLNPEPAKPTQMPARGDQVEQWLREQRDTHMDQYGTTPAWFLLDDLLENYRLHADTGTPLDQHVCEGLIAGDCDCFEQSPSN